MRKILIYILAVMLCISCAITVSAANEEVNKIDAVTSTFEGITDIKQTKWYKLIDARGDSSISAAHYDNIAIKTDGGHSGNNYLSMTAEQSWYSPSINIYPFLKAAGGGTYILSFWYRCSASYSPRNFVLVRSRSEDVFENETYGIDIQPRNGNNFYGYINGTYSDPDDNGWKCFVSEPFDVEDELLADEHCWWFCVDSLPSNEFTYDIDDFCIAAEDEFDDPTYVEEEKVVTDLTYLTDDVKNNVIDAVEVTAPPVATPTPDANVTPDAPQRDDANSTFDATAYIIGAIVLIACLVVALTVTVLIKKKNK